MLRTSVGVVLAAATLSFASLPTGGHDARPITGLDLQQVPGRLLDRTPEPNAMALYRDSVGIKYGLTEDEQRLLTRHGFVVTERVHPTSFGDGFLDVYVKDLPVFVSTDAVLHALHMSYDDVLKATETSVLLPLFEDALWRMHGEVPALAEAYAALPAMERPIRDLDVYLTVAKTLLSAHSAQPAFPDNSDAVSDLVRLATAADGPALLPLFSEGPREVDFSQFKPRGHYTGDPRLQRYFRAMQWLGRTELYLSAPATDAGGPSVEDVRRQAILAHLLAEVAESSGAAEGLGEAEAMLALFVGDPDNVTLEGLAALAESAGARRASDLLDDSVWARYRSAVEEAPFAAQRIRSQLLTNGPGGVGQTRPAAAFLLVGQRFALDSYVLSRLVYDELQHEGKPVRRMLPSSLDVLYALGNDAALPLLQPELERYPYGEALQSVRAEVDGLGPEAWTSSLYGAWLGAIRAMNPPGVDPSGSPGRGSLPGFMQTDAWWRQKMNTQLASWAQLRHDNLLYAKPSYSVSLGCSFPYSFVEPEPDVFRAVSAFARRASEGFGPHAEDGDREVTREGASRIRAYYDRFAEVTDTLATLAEKQLVSVAPDEAERSFLKRMVFEAERGCVRTLDGWYVDLFFGGASSARETDLVVADVHTAPTDEQGSGVGWVLHAGTAPLDLAVVTAEVPGVGVVAFAGPVLSYREHLSTGFRRLTDEEWAAEYEGAPSVRPAFTRSYLAGPDGRAYANAKELDG
jgi:hypothetical protein